MDKEFVENIKKVYNLLQDDVSKQIFAGRLLYSLTGDMTYMRSAARTVKSWSKIYTRMKSEKQKNILFGAGIIGGFVIDTFDDINFECFVDNNRAGEICRGLPIIDIGTLKAKYFNDLVIISSRSFYNQIFEQLLSEGFKPENIINLGKELENLNREQYFDLQELKSDINEKEIFVDGGCFDGESSCEFKKWCNNSGVKESFIYAWEPEPTNIENCKRTLTNNQYQYELINKGLWSEKTQLCFKVDAGSSTICDNGTIKIDVDSIDNLIDSPVTFIKLDVEGSEYEALLGAEKTIKKHKPKLAICVYHKPEDIWQLPTLIHNLNPKYKFYLRHYSLITTETVLYAIDSTK